jgi:hypothetical protein
MNDDRNNQIREWLAAEGDSRKEAIAEASKTLLKDYTSIYEHFIPIELHRLAITLNSEIISLENMQGDASLIPTQNGFRILVNSNLYAGRYRASIVHEFAHTLFYTNPAQGKPRRLFPQSSREEHFCFDVARNILAYEPHLRAIGLDKENDPAIIFTKLTDIFLLSRPWAARVMLADRGLATGIGGRWLKIADEWKLTPGSSAATPLLSARERIKLRNLAKEYLKDPNFQPEGYKIIAVKEKMAEGIFVLVIKK